MSAERAIRWWKAWSLCFVVGISGRRCSPLAGCVGDKSMSNRCNRDAWQLATQCWHVEIEIDRKSLPPLRIVSNIRRDVSRNWNSSWDRWDCLRCRFEELDLEHNPNVHRTEIRFSSIQRPSPVMISQWWRLASSDSCYTGGSLSQTYLLLSGASAASTSDSMSPWK